MLINNLNNEILTTISNLIYMIILMFAVSFYLYNIRKIQRKKTIEQKKEINIYKEQLRKNKKEIKSNFLTNYLNLLEDYFIEKNVKNPHSYIQVVVIFSIIFSVIIAVFVNLLIGVITFFIIHLLLSVILKNLIEAKSSESEYKLPEVIDLIIRSFSKNDELQVVIYETSLGVEEPFASLFSTMAREMTSSGHLFVLNKYSKKTNSIWINSLFSILIKYKEDAKKEDTVTNLKHLRNMISQENNLKRRLISDKRYNVFLNYILATVSVIGNIIIFVFLPDIFRSSYLNSPIGIVILFSGYASVFTVIMITKKLGNKGKVKLGGNK